MFNFRNKSVVFVAFFVFVLAFGMVISPLPKVRTSASDHIDSPSNAQDRGSDIDDNWAFVSHV